MKGLLHFWDGQRIIFLPFDRIAMLRDDASGRLEATSTTGEVVHRDGSTADVPAGPWLRIQKGVLVHPAHVTVVRKVVHVPGGWTFRYARPLPKPPPTPLEAVIPAAKATPSEVLYLRAEGHHPFWVTERGTVRGPARVSMKMAAAMHPHMIWAGVHWVNAMRLHAAESGRRNRLRLDDGTVLPVAYGTMQRVLKGLGIASIDAIEKAEPDRLGFYRESLRDYPDDLGTVEAARLKAWFGDDERLLVANVLWQTVAMRRAGRDPEHGASARGYWYRRLMPTLIRAGMLAEGRVEQVVGLTLACAPPLLEVLTRGRGRFIPVKPARHPFAPFIRFQMVLTDLVGTWRLFTFEELGFKDRFERHIGAKRPAVILLAEKPTVEHLVWPLAERFGTSVHFTGGNPGLEATEHFVRALRRRRVQEVVIVALVDFDCFGWRIAESFAEQLGRYGVRATSVHFLVRAERFTAEEIRLYAHAITGDQRIRTLARRWVERGGGIGGKAMGIHCDHFRSMDRLVQAFIDETGLKPIGPP